MTKTHMNCRQCGVAVQVEVRDGDGVWTVFCCPEHAWDWQDARTEEQIIEETSGWKMPYDRCQWCRCTLKSGYHDRGCPVRDVAKARRASAAG